MCAKNFIKTQDAYTKDKLLSMNFQLVNHDNDIYTFVNTKNVLTFDDNDMKVVFSNNISL